VTSWPPMALLRRELNHTAICALSPAPLLPQATGNIIFSGACAFDATPYIQS
jgi:hypothetical protein